MIALKVEDNQVEVFKDIFTKFDYDGDGMLNIQEFHQGKLSLVQSSTSFKAESTTWE